MAYDPQEISIIIFTPKPPQHILRQIFPSSPGTQTLSVCGETAACAILNTQSDFLYTNQAASHLYIRLPASCVKTNLTLATAACVILNTQSDFLYTNQAASHLYIELPSSRVKTNLTLATAACVILNTQSDFLYTNQAASHLYIRLPSSRVKTNLTLATAACVILNTQYDFLYTNQAASHLYITCIIMREDKSHLRDSSLCHSEHTHSLIFSTQTTQQVTYTSDYLHHA